MALRTDLKAIPAYHFAEKPCSIKLDQNESPFSLPQALHTELFERLKKVALNRYPELSAHSLRERLANYHSWPVEGIVMSAGSNVLIQALVIAAGMGQTVLSVKPSFSVYGLQARVLGANLLEIALEDDFTLPKKALLEALEGHQGVFFLANPAAPTANLFDEASLRELAEASKGKWLMVIDEAYHQFSGTDYAFLAKDYAHVLCLRTFSKAFGLGGVRLGYSLSTKDLAKEVQKTVLPFSISALQLTIGQFVLEHPELIQETIRCTLAERERLSIALKALTGITVYPSTTNFILIRVANPEALYHALLERSICIRRQDHLAQLEGCLRISVGKPEENDALLQALSDILR